MLIDDDEITGDLPLEIEDEYITALGSFTQPTNRVPVISGFVRITRLFRVLSRILVSLRKAKRFPDGSDQPELARLQITDFAAALQSEIDDLPAVLDLFNSNLDCSVPQIHAFETCKANLLVTHALARFELYQFAFLTGVYDHQLDAMTQSVLKRLDVSVFPSSLFQLAMTTNCAGRRLII